MNLSLMKNKIIIMIVVAAFFQLISFILSQVLVKIDEDLENKNYKIISNEIKLKDIDMHLNQVIPNLLVFSINQRLNSQLYLKYYEKSDYEESLSPIFQNLKFYFDYIKDDFFILENNKLNEQISNIENELDQIKDKSIIKKLLLLEQKLYPIFNQLMSFRKQITEESNLLSLDKDKYKSVRHRINLGLVITQILNLLFLTLFFFFVVVEPSREMNKVDKKN